ncbi:MAG: MBOAT family protein [Proteobacteria bacterium]|nr:MBOAT family protein [Pseudomonadota bacterium]
MIFNSNQYFVFFVLVLPMVLLLPKARLQNVVLVIASYFFYGWWDARLLALILFSTFVDFFIAQAIEKRQETKTKHLVALSVCTNLTVLFFFKYFNFFVGSLIFALAQLGVDARGAHLEIILPVGISFYTFQSMGYTIDVYRGRLKAVQDPILFALYVSFFPQLVAGPIERAENLLPQLTQRKRLDLAGLSEGLWLITLGLCQKVVLADNVAAIANDVFSSKEALPSSISLLGVLAFTLQIYGDFAGYSNMARGCSRLLGINLIQNFRRPYFSRSPQEFWTRWHISLSSWLRDYLYISLGGNRGDTSKTIRNLMLTMTLGGLWHGATWMFVLWGVYHGTVLIVHRLWRRIRPDFLVQGLARLPYSACAWLLMMVVTCVGWLLFRAETVPQALGIIESIFGGWEWTADSANMLSLMYLYFIPFLLIDVLSEWADRNGKTDDAVVLRFLPPAARGLIIAVLLLWLAALSAPEGPIFIYFQF